MIDLSNMNKKTRGIPAALLMPLLLMAGCQSSGTEDIESSLSDISHVCLSTHASIIGLSNTTLDFSGNASIGGSVILLGASTLKLSGNVVIRGETDSRSSDEVSCNGANASAGTRETKDWTDHEAALLDFARQAQNLAPTQVFDQIGSAATVNGSGGLNVVEVKHGIQLAGTDRLLFSGNRNDLFVVVVDDGGISLSGQASIGVSGKLAPRNLLFIIEGRNTLSLTGNASATGSFLDPDGGAVLSGNGHLKGALAAYGTILISGNGLSITADAWCPEMDGDDSEDDNSPAPQPAPSSSPSPAPTPSSAPSPVPAPAPTSAPMSTPAPSCGGTVCTTIIA